MLKDMMSRVQKNRNRGHQFESLCEKEVWSEEIPTESMQKANIKRLVEAVSGNVIADPTVTYMQIVRHFEINEYRVGANNFVKMD